MKRYRILKPILLGFTTPQEQYDAIVRPNSSELEANEHTIWLIQKGIRLETNTMANAIHIWLRNGSIEEQPGT